jgi:copper chaperone CopZ
LDDEFYVPFLKTVGGFMKLKSLLLVAIFFGSPRAAQAEAISVQVKGMVCAFCAQGIEKKFKENPDVSKVSVSLQTKLIDLEIKEGKVLSDENIKTVVTDSGYDVVKIERKK